MPKSRTHKPSLHSRTPRTRNVSTKKSASINDTRPAVLFDTQQQRDIRSAPGAAPELVRSKSISPEADERQSNRMLSADRVLELIKSRLPVAFSHAVVVRKWVWVSFPDKQPRHITSVLSKLGFHWNSRRKVWQHPCGAIRAQSKGDFK